MRVIRPHPRFRLFLHADPSNGDVSRAMRNRCVELALIVPTTGEPTSCRPAGLGALTSSSSRADELEFTGLAYARSLGLLRREEPTSESLMRDVTDVAGSTSGTFAQFRRDVAVGA